MLSVSLLMFFSYFVVNLFVNFNVGLIVDFVDSVDDVLDVKQH